MLTHCLVALLLIAFARQSDGARYTDQMFRRAMAKDNLAVSGSFTMSPLYVLIALCDAAGRPERVGCVTANFLSGAIHLEHALGYDTEGEKKAYRIAIAQRDRVFCFKKVRARNNVSVRYTPSQLAEVRRQLTQRSDAQLRAEVDREDSFVSRIYRRIHPGRRRFWHSDAHMEAVAHVLLERGILVGQTHWGPVLYVDKPSNQVMQRAPKAFGSADLVSR
jgi:hypothetical protein